MKDLKFSYENCNGEEIHLEYDTIMDFLNDIESEKMDIPMLDDEKVNAIFFENKLNQKKFNSIFDLVEHCKNIIK